MPVMMTVAELERFFLAEFRKFSIPRVALRSKPCGSAAAACDRLSASARCGQAVRFRGRP
jgi:hypothetical protein